MEQSLVPREVRPFRADKEAASHHQAVPLAGLLAPTRVAFPRLAGRGVAAKAPRAVQRGEAPEEHPATAATMARVDGRAEAGEVVVVHLVRVEHPRVASAWVVLGRSEVLRLAGIRARPEEAEVTLRPARRPWPQQT